MKTAGTRSLRFGCMALAASLGLAAQPVWAQATGAAEAGLPWQVGALFTVNWVLAAVAVAVMSRPIKRLDKPKKIVESLEE